MEANICVNIFVVSVIFAANSDSCSPQYGSRIRFYDNKKISQSVMWTVNSLTKAECLAECYKEKYCLSVHFSPLEPACVALRERFDGVSVDTTGSSWYQLFQTEKPLSTPGSDCEIDVDCVSLTNSHCHEGGCRCLIGYGPNGTLCTSLNECDGFADSFTMYAGFDIYGHDFQRIEPSGGITSLSCQQYCLDSPKCKSADYNFMTSYCYLNDMTWFDVPSHERGPSQGFDFYQRDCRIWG